MTEEALLTCDETPSVLAEIHARAGHRCDLCGVRNFAIGGRDADGRFAPLYQERPDAAAARQQLKKFAWCGTDSRVFVARIFRVVCEVVTIVDENGPSPLLLCGRCTDEVRKISKRRAAA